MKKIGFIGCGNMAASIVAGLIDDGYPANAIWASSKTHASRDRFAQNFKVSIANDNRALVDEADVVILAVKPQQVRSVIEEIRENLARKKPLLLSVAVGLRIRDMLRWADVDLSIIRVMPNTPSLLKAGASGLYASKGVSDEEKELAESIMRAVGIVAWAKDEAAIDTIASLSGSGPAYFFLVMEAMKNAAESMGLSSEEAHLLTVQTAFGAAKIALETHESPEVLRRQVTSPNGTTEQAIKVLQSREIEAIFLEAMQAAKRRANEIADELSQ